MAYKKYYKTPSAYSKGFRAGMRYANKKKKTSKRRYGWRS